MAEAPSAAVLVGDSVKVLRAYKMDAIADLAEAKLDPNRQLRTVVVVGEVQRGKSSLVNALIGRGNLCPAGVNATSSVPISVTDTAELDDDPTIELFFPSGPKQVTLPELDGWVTMDGANLPAADELPTGAAIGVRSSLLPNTTVVDTPGVGGLDSDLTRLSQQSAQQACVLVLACEASTPITKPELDFVRDATSSIDSVVVVVTKTDKNLRRWRQIVAENDKILRRELGRPIRVVGVSSLLATFAATTEDPEAREELENECGIGPLRAELTKRLDDLAELPDRDAVRTCQNGLETVRARIVRELSAIKEGAAALPDLDADLARLNDLKDQSRQWEQYLARDLVLLKQSAVDRLDRRLDAIRDHWSKYINTNGMAVLRQNEQKFTAEMQADMQRAMTTTLGEFVQQLHDEVIAPRFAETPEVWAELSKQITASLTGRRVESHEVGSKKHGLFDPTLLTMGVVGSSSLVGALGLTAASAWTGVGLIAGTLWIGINLGFRAVRAGKANLLAWLRETIGVTRSSTTRLLETVVAQARPEIIIRYREQLRTNIDTLQSTIAEIRKASQEDADARAKKVARLEGNLAVVDKRLAASQAYLAGGAR